LKKKGPASPLVRLCGVPGPGAWAQLVLGILDGTGLPEPVARALRPAGEGPIVCALRDEEALEDLEDALRALSAVRGAKVETAFFGEDPAGRAEALERLHRGARIVLATPEGLAGAAPGAGEYAALRLALHAGEKVPRGPLVERLAALGYRRVEFAEAPGEFAIRGAVVDLFPPEPARPARLLFDGDRVESIRLFDPSTQAGLTDFLDEAVAVPAPPDPAAGETVAAPAAPSATLRERLSDALWLYEEGLLEEPPARAVVVGISSAEGLDLGGAEPPVVRGDMGLLAARLAEWERAGWTTLLFSLNRGEDERVQEMLERRAGGAQFLIGPLRRGFLLPGLKLAVLSTAEIFGRRYRPPRGWAAKHAGAGRLRWGELRKGDYVVHERCGVARYHGLETVRVRVAPDSSAPREDGKRILGRAAPSGEEESATDCLTLEFRGGDRMFIPMTDFRQVQKFVGAEGARPRLSSLEGEGWEEVQERVREGVREMADELLRLQAERAALPGRAFGGPTRMEEEFAESFPFEETPDQRRAIEEVCSDMQSPHPMDRVVVGDVGFGKTEVAMRAALKCAANGAQCALLVPTTILADQHLRVFRARFAEYPVRVVGLSRFQTAAEQRRTLEALARGEADVVVGTHRLLQGDVRFKDLGLLVIDEEHRFGVRDKERLKALRKDVHSLALSATPIPRTLYQALSGLRGVSLIRSAPTGRQPISTGVLPYDLRHVCASIEAELARGGQVFYLCNRVRDLPARVAELRERLPGLRIAVAHGQMRADALETAMWDFFNRKSDVLAASTIIESGLDIPTVNTLLVEDAHAFGLSQLYQLRGRIGRERQKAYCWLYYPAKPDSEEPLTEEARARLRALREFTQLGSGLQLAMRDLEIRGAGDLLGSRQSGYLNSVGLEFYCQMLDDEVRRLQRRKGAKRPPEPPTMDLAVPAFLPEDYLPGDFERIEFYKRLLGAEEADFPRLEAELTDLSGPPPEPVRNLFRVLRLRRAAAAFGVRVVAERPGAAEVHFHPGGGPEAEVLSRWMGELGPRLEFLRSSEGDGFRVRLGGEAAVDRLEALFARKMVK
jgi:transcription-repair coupling factor (superfamily II helicase)